MRALIPFALAVALTLAAGVSALAEQASTLLCAVINVVECSARGR